MTDLYMLSHRRLPSSSSCRLMLWLAASSRLASAGFSLSGRYCCLARVTTFLTEASMFRMARLVSCKEGWIEQGKLE